MNVKCRNCGETVSGKFCGNCGQDAKVGDINLQNLLSQVNESVFLVNKGFFYTLVNLFSRPGESVKDFLNGKRKSHFKPIGYALILSTAYFLMSRIAEQNTLADDLLYGFLNYEPDNGVEVPPLLSWFSSNYAYTTLLLLPVFSLASYVCFLGYGRNYFEHIVLSAYLTGQQAIFYTLFILLEVFIKHDILEVIPVILSITYAFWVFWQFFADGNRILNVIRSLFTYVLYLIIMALFLGTVGDVG